MRLKASARSFLSIPSLLTRRVSLVLDRARNASAAIAKPTKTNTCATSIICIPTSQESGLAPSSVAPPNHQREANPGDRPSVEPEMHLRGQLQRDVSAPSTFRGRLLSRPH